MRKMNYLPLLLLTCLVFYLFQRRRIIIELILVFIGGRWLLRRAANDYLESGE
ncbi:MAG: hypothetical protein ABF651_04455 [Sporolactobacillus sp.]